MAQQKKVWFFRVADSDAMTAITRIAMLLCTLLISLVAWQANQLINQLKDQAAQITAVVVHQLTTDGEVQTIRAISDEQSKRLERLENDFYRKGGR